MSVCAIAANVQHYYKMYIMGAALCGGAHIGSGGVEVCWKSVFLIKFAL